MTHATLLCNEEVMVLVLEDKTLVVMLLVVDVALDVTTFVVMLLMVDIVLGATTFVVIDIVGSPALTITFSCGPFALERRPPRFTRTFWSTTPGSRSQIFSFREPAGISKLFVVDVHPPAVTEASQPVGRVPIA
jgi:hypothetical protein